MHLCMFLIPYRPDDWMKRAKAKKESFVKTELEDMQIQEQFSGMPKWHTTLSPSLENDQECLKEAAFENLYCSRLSHFSIENSLI